MSEGRRVLVVDDEANIRDLIEVALRFHGFATVTAETGEKALRAAAAERPDLVLLDVMLPDIDGFEICRRLRADGNQVPVIFAEQGVAGAGLGLPIVAAIAAAHGGTAELLSEPSRGTTVRITLPHSISWTPPE